MVVVLLQGLVAHHLYTHSTHTPSKQDKYFVFEKCVYYLCNCASFNFLKREVCSSALPMHELQISLSVYYSKYLIKTRTPVAVNKVGATRYIKY